MKEQEAVAIIKQWLIDQGFQPQTEVMIGRGTRRIRVDILFEKDGFDVAIEVKTDKTGVYDGLGKALTYLAYGTKEVWLAVPTGLFNKLKVIHKQLRLPITLFDFKKTKFVEPLEGKIWETWFVKVRYVCPICGEVIKPRRKWLNLHMRSAHKACANEVLETIGLLREGKITKAQIEWHKSHSDE